MAASMAVTKRDDKTTIYVHVRNPMCPMRARDNCAAEVRILGQQCHSSSLALWQLQSAIRILSSISEEREVSERGNDEG
jgi:hypothetical protein